LLIQTIDSYCHGGREVCIGLLLQERVLCEGWRYLSQWN